MNQYYFIHVWGDVEPKIYGPYKNCQNRFKKCIKCVEENGLEENSYFWLDNNNGKLSIGTYSSRDLDPNTD